MLNKTKNLRNRNLQKEIKTLKKGNKLKGKLPRGCFYCEKGAKEITRELNVKLSLHYCSSSFKDAVQLKNRILRRAKNIAKKYEIITKDGTLVKGVIEIVKENENSKKIGNKISISDLESLKNSLIKNYKIDKKLIAIDKEKNRIEIAVWILEKMPKLENCKYFAVEEYPSADSWKLKEWRFSVRKRDCFTLIVKQSQYSLTLNTVHSNNHL